MRGEPRADLVRELAAEVRSSRIRTPMRSRRALAAVLTSAALLIPFAAFGGVGLAAQAAKNAAQTVSGGGNGNSDNAKSNGNAQGGTANTAQVQSNTPADNEYRPGKGCGDKNHIHTGPPGNPSNTECPH